MNFRVCVMLFAAFIGLTGTSGLSASDLGLKVTQQAKGPNLQGPGLHWVAHTPHWNWASELVGASGASADQQKTAVDAKPLRVVFVLNNLGRGEAGELSKRFGFDAWVTPVVSSNSYRNQFDETALEARLAEPTDLIIMSVGKPARDLSPKAQGVIKAAVDAGTPLLFITHQNDLAKQWPLWKDLTKAGSLQEALFSRFPIDRPVRSAGEVTLYEQGKARVVIASQFAPAFVYFDAFEPRYLDHETNPWAMETGYAIVGWLARATLEYPALPATPVWREQGEGGWSLNQPVELKYALAVAKTADKTQGKSVKKLVNQPAAKTNNKTTDTSGDTVSDTSSDTMTVGHAIPSRTVWDVYDQFGQRMAQGVMEAEQADKSITFTPGASGPVLLRWRQFVQGRLVDWGIQRFDVQSPMKLDKIALDPAQAPANDGLSLASRSITWQTTGQTAKAGDHVLAQVYDPDGRLVGQTKAAATAGKLEIKPWPVTFTSYKLRTLLVRGDSVLDEQRQWFAMPLSRADDLKSFRVILWSNEVGRPSERWRYPLIRKMGVDTLATLGSRINPNLWASQAGMRLLPTNVFVPPNRYTNMKTYDPKVKQQRLDDLAKTVTPYTPLGYSLADEPDARTDLFDWKAIAAKIIHQHDPGAPVGYCGVWLKNAMDVPGFFKNIPVAEMYSPTYLYTPNLWYGTERDLMRSFAKENTLLTSWTHYVTARNREPYARTVPWLWLFEGFKGVSYFCSAYGNFTTLDPDLTPVRDMRWAMEELHNIRQGAGTQLISMKRQTGQVRILFIQDSGQTQSWAMTLNRMNMPWCYTTADALASDVTAKFVIVPDVVSLSDANLDQLQQAVDRGVSLLAFSPLGVINDQGKLASGDRLEKLFGVRRNDTDVKINAKGKGSEADKLKDAVTKDLKIRSGAQVQTRLDTGPWQASPLTVHGHATGEYELTIPAPGSVSSGTKGKPVIVPYTSLGDRELASHPDLPDVMRDLARSPAAVVIHHAQATTTLLTFTPRLEDSQAMLVPLLDDAKVSSPEVSILVNAKPTDLVYLYPFKKGSIQMMGVVADQWRIKPAQEMKDRDSVDYQAHGFARWAAMPVTVKLSKRLHVYDARQGKDLGWRDSVDFSLTPGQPALLAMLPYTIDAVGVEAPKTLSPGDTLNAAISMTISSAGGQQSYPAEGHVVHVTWQPPEGVDYPGRSEDVMMHQGKTVWRDMLPLNAPAGVWTLTARDFISGKQAIEKITIKPADAKVVADAHMLAPQEEPYWMKFPSTLPKGQWTAYEDQPDQDAAVALSVQNLRRSKKYISGDHRGHEYLSGGFRLGNPKITYQMKYSVCNDAKAHDWSDPRQADAPYLPGLGINRPAPNLWYYNGYIVISINGKSAAGYRLSELKAVPRTDKMGQVDVAWETPYGLIRLSSAMNPTQTGMYQQLTIEPAEPIESIAVQFRSYPRGFDHTGRTFFTIDPEHQTWMVFGDSVNDPAFFPKAFGAGGILIDPSQWTKVNFKGFNFRVEHPDNPTKDTIHLNWVLWEFPKIGNEQAVDTLRNEAADYQQQMHKVFNPRYIKPQDKP